MLTRYDIERAEFQAFKTVLLDYLQRFVDEISRHMPQIADALRALATEAMRSLLLNLRRIVAGAEREHGRYAELLRLVHWFDEADDATAHALWASVFGLDPSRHVGFAVTEADEHTPPTTSWLAGPRAQVPVMLRETGQRRIAGRSGRAEDFTEAKQRRLAEHARREEARRRAEHARREEARRRAVAEIARHRGRLERVRLSDAAREALLDLVLSRCGELTGG